LANVLSNKHNMAPCLMSFRSVTDF
jgi:hypothetical protein